MHYLNCASQRLVGKVWCTPRYFEVYVLPDVMPLALLTLEVLGEERSCVMEWSARMLCRVGPLPLFIFTVRQSGTCKQRSYFLFFHFLKQTGHCSHD